MVCAAAIAATTHQALLSAGRRIIVNPRKTAILLLSTAVLPLALIACGGDSKDKGILSGNGVTVEPQTSGQSATQTTGSGSASGGAKPTTAPSNGGNSSGSSSGSGGGNVSGNELAALYTNFAKQKSFRGTITVSGGSAQGQQITMEFVQPDKAHITMNGGPTGSVELISIGTDSYIKIAGTWTKQPGTGTKLFDTNTLSDSIKEAEKTSVTKGGTDTVNGKKCQIYTTSTTTELCVAYGLPLRVVSKGTGSSGNTTIIFSDFGSNIDIKAPI
jgi:hypothetical protein